MSEQVAKFSRESLNSATQNRPQRLGGVFAAGACRAGHGARVVVCPRGFGVVWAVMVGKGALRIVAGVGPDFSLPPK